MWLNKECKKWEIIRTKDLVIDIDAITDAVELKRASTPILAPMSSSRVSSSTKRLGDARPTRQRHQRWPKSFFGDQEEEKEEEEEEEEGRFLLFLSHSCSNLPPVQSLTKKWKSITMMTLIVIIIVLIEIDWRFNFTHWSNSSDVFCYYHRWCYQFIQCWMLFSIRIETFDRLSINRWFFISQSTSWMIGC